MNIQKLRELRSFVLLHAPTYDQGTWGRQFCSAPRFWGKTKKKGKKGKSKSVECGYAACLAGFTVLQEKGVRAYKLALNENEILNGSVFNIARNVLGLTTDQAEKLFVGTPSFNTWGPYADMFANAETNEDKAYVAAALLTAIIEGGYSL